MSFLKKVEVKAAQAEELEQDVYSLSSGTISNLTGLKKNIDINRFQVALGNWAHKHASKYKNWMDAFEGYMTSVGVDLIKRPSGTVADPDSFEEKLGYIFKSK